jgi:hypothetical protein
MHLLLWFEDGSKIRTPAEVDSLISAEFPNPDTHPRLYKLVSELMTHGPCGAEKPNAPCMKDGSCSKHFPKGFCEFTSVNGEGYPTYRRRDDHREHEVRGHKFDNRHVVPYCPALLLIMECHLNVELTFNVRSIKYIHKYIYKGHDRTTMEFGKAKDEIKQFIDAHYISAHEAFWRLLENEIHTQVPPVIALPVHKQNEQPVIFDAMQGPEEALNAATHSKTKLMA